ncbi:AMP-binding protein [Micromonospora sp. HM5-17]|uniref:AMP-binding protein n=1 Tax=Micromonospora sp. HM5-17 TaxID=2487710 RepID=UPI000F49C4B9|nr:AMP-binding protein [Micromonospora sp. HM5-17]ROT26092.1 AMP-dependent synthetase [Micromonospora sp. HM5-17]
MPLITDWLTDPIDGRGVHLADGPDGGWRYTSYSQLASSALRIAAALRARGVTADDVVCVGIPASHTCLAVLFGAWACGATVSILPPPTPFQPEAQYTAHTAAILRQAAPVVVVTSPELAGPVRRAAVEAGLPDVLWTPRPAEEPGTLQPPGTTALLQFTSGSTGVPRAVRVTWSNIDANLGFIQRRVEWSDHDGCASWLPLHHDMGLIGCLLASVARQTNLWLMRPDQFIRDPARWLALFAPGQATLSAASSFAFEYAVRRVPQARLATLDLSGMRSTVVGAEMVDATVLDRFARHAEPAGFTPRGFTPAYGLAEHTLAVSFAAHDEAPRMTRVDWSGLSFGAPAPVLGAGRLGDVPLEETGWLVGHGYPPESEGVHIRILDDAGEPLPVGHVGEIAVSSPSVAAGYRGADHEGSTRFVGRELRTGDAGFVHDGELYVLGRMGDSLKLRGRNVFVEDLDVRVAEATGLPKSGVAAVSMVHSGGQGVALFAEAKDLDWVPRARRLLREELGPEPQITIIVGRRGLVARTSSGKPRRRFLWQQLRAGSLTDVTIDPDLAPAGTAT